MKKFICLSRDYLRGDVEVCEIKAKDEDTAWQIVEETVATNYSHDWLFDVKSWKEFVAIIGSGKV